jgi:hypothetical protein
MDKLTPDILSNAVIGALVVIGAIGVYLKTLRQPKPDPLFSGVAGGLVDREQMERLIQEVKRIADAITDKNAATMTDKLDELADKIDHMRSPPSRRR